jgi:hypothetical protein
MKEAGRFSTQVRVTHVTLICVTIKLKYSSVTTAVEDFELCWQISTKVV